MRSAQSVEDSKLRQRLAQLLWRLRFLRRCQLPSGELARRVNIILTEAGSIRRYVKVTLKRPDDGPPLHSLALCIDKDELRELERGHGRSVNIEEALTVCSRGRSARL